MSDPVVLPDTPTTRDSSEWGAACMEALLCGQRESIEWGVATARLLVSPQAWEELGREAARRWNSCASRAGTEMAEWMRVQGLVAQRVCEQGCSWAGGGG